MDGLLSDTFSMSVLLCIQYPWLCSETALNMSFPPLCDWIALYFTICSASEKYFLESFTTSSLIASSPSVWLSSVSASVMHHPFFLISMLITKSKHIIRHHNPLNPLLSLFRTCKSLLGMTFLCTVNALMSH